MADRRRIMQVLGNLLSNAARHSSESSAIRVSAVRDVREPVDGLTSQKEMEVEVVVTAYISALWVASTRSGGSRPPKSAKSGRTELVCGTQPQNNLD